ncbi:MAG: signal peptidase I [Lachnospiraceae bacterium]|nr:signal peptidase I [Lachnospiraceae bacterium]
MNKEEKDQEPLNLKKEIWEWIKVILIAVLITVCLKTFVIVNAEVPTSSMVSLIDPGDRLVGFRLSYLFSDPERGDVVIFKYPVNPREKFIKRVIGLPGETVEIRDGEIFIDGSDTPLVEDYLPEQWVVANDGIVYEVPEDSYLVLGDNRNHSLDARFWPEEALRKGVAATPEEAAAYSFVNRKQILGKAIFKYYPHIARLS